MRIRTLFIALLAVFLATTMVAQSVNVTTGSIIGVVRDNTGAPLPGVTVTVTNADTGLTRNTFTGNEGAYTLNLLPPGTYRLDAALEGLGKSAVPKVTVLLGNSTKADV